MNTTHITRLEVATLVGQRPRKAGCNARLGEHGATVNVPLARLTTADGAVGFGAYRGTEAQAAQLLNQPLEALISLEEGVAIPWLAFEYPLWDLMGQREGQPVYALLAHMVGRSIANPFSAPCYDTSLYIDDLHLESEQEAAALIAAEAMQGYERGHRAFKLKVGRGARHMPLEAGTQRDIAVIQAVRSTVGTDCTMMLDANNGYNLNLTKHVLAETANCSIFWMEEAFHEDPILYQDLRQWLNAQNLPTLIADGEGLAAPPLLDWAQSGWVDVIQYDIFGYGFTPWLKTGQQLDTWGVRTAPHHYGRHYGNYVTGHLAAVIEGFTFVEWDEVTTPGLDGSGYTIDQGQVLVPAAPGFGLTLDDTIFRQAVADNGYTLV
jgi:L-alanine-DL-glutamate epimerase-like enolase superfamily enzyme